MKKITFDNDVYAVHENGDRLYLPRWDAKGDLILSGLPTVAITITAEGKTFPEGSVYLRDRRGRIKRGWTLAHGSEKASNLAHFRGVESSELRS